MPMVKVYVNQDTRPYLVNRLTKCCRVLVAAAMSSDGHAVMPSSVKVFISKTQCSGREVIVEVEAKDFPDRRGNLERRADAFIEALSFAIENSSQISERMKILVEFKLVCAGFSQNFEPDYEDDPEDSDMSMNRVLERLGMRPEKDYNL